MADFNNPPLIRHAEGSWHYKDFLRVCKSMQSCQLSINHYFFKKSQICNQQMFPALIISLGSIFYPLAPKNYCPMHEPSCSYILFHISLFSTGGHMKTICLKSLPVLVFHLFLCEINRILLDFVVNPSCTPINICKSLWGSSMSHPNSIEKNSIICSRNQSRQWQILSKIHAGPLCPFT